MNIAIIGSTAYLDKMKTHAEKLEKEGHSVTLPALDSHPEFNELGICAYNQALIASADEIHVIWDGRSTGTIFDLGMCFALGKPIVVAYLNSKSFTNLLEQYGRLSAYVKNSGGDEEKIDVEKLKEFGKETND